MNNEQMQKIKDYISEKLRTADSKTEMRKFVRTLREVLLISIDTRAKLLYFIDSEWAGKNEREEGVGA